MLGAMLGPLAREPADSVLNTAAREGMLRPLLRSAPLSERRAGAARPRAEVEPYDEADDRGSGGPVNYDATDNPANTPRATGVMGSLGYARGAGRRADLK